MAGSRKRAVSARVQGAAGGAREGRDVARRLVAREFEPSEQTIRNWVKQADLDEGRRSDGLTTRSAQGAEGAEAGRTSGCAWSATS